MISIGYSRASDDTARQQDQRALAGAGCHRVRLEVDPKGQPTLGSTLDFLAQGDELVVPRLTALSNSCADVLNIVAQLNTKGARLRVLDTPLLENGGGELLASVLKAAMDLELGRRRSSIGRNKFISDNEIQALAAEGLGPTAIGAELGISRMTVYRRLKTKIGGPASTREAKRA